MDGEEQGVGEGQGAGQPWGMAEEEATDQWEGQAMQAGQVVPSLERPKPSSCIALRAWLHLTMGLLPCSSQWPLGPPSPTPSSALGPSPSTFCQHPCICGLLSLSSIRLCAIWPLLSVQKGRWLGTWALGECRHNAGWWLLLPRA